MKEPQQRRIVVPRDLKSVEAIYVFLGESLAFPSYFGFNLDALYDCATSDICQPVCVIWPKEWEGGNPYLYLNALRVLGVLMDAAEENPNLMIEQAD